MPSGIAVNMDLSASIFSACEDANGRPLSMIEVIKSVRAMRIFLCSAKCTLTTQLMGTNPRDDREWEGLCQNRRMRDRIARAIKGLQVTTTLKNKNGSERTIRYKINGLSEDNANLEFDFAEPLGRISIAEYNKKTYDVRYAQHRMLAASCRQPLQAQVPVRPPADQRQQEKPQAHPRRAVLRRPGQPDQEDRPAAPGHGAAALWQAAHRAHRHV